MNKAEIAQALRNEVGHLEVEIKRLHARCERLKAFVLDLEQEINGPSPPPRKTIFDTRFGKVVEQVFAEKPKRPKR